ncbi:ATP-binding protein [Nonomuraea typhae]|uniref:histidine kinase n=1 Tax=Nonomuraea typhae TaxID=2603600 RepID=A0ABW7Z2F4_9ACTN
MSLRVKIALALAATALAVSAVIGVLVHARTAETQLDAARRTLDDRFQSLLERQAEGQDAGLTVGPARVPPPLLEQVTEERVRATYLAGDTLWAATALEGTVVSLTTPYTRERAALADLDGTLLLSGALATLAASLAGIAVAAGLSRRVRHVARTATLIASGDLTARVFPAKSPVAAPSPPGMPATSPSPSGGPPAHTFPANDPTTPASSSLGSTAPGASTPDSTTAGAGPLDSSTPGSSSPGSTTPGAGTPDSTTAGVGTRTSPAGHPAGGGASPFSRARAFLGRPRRRGDEVVAVGRALDRMADALQARLEAERRVTADIAHELRTPVAGLTTAAGLLPPGRPTELVRDRAAVLGKLVEDVLEVARLDAHTDQPVLERRLLSALARRALTAAGAREAELVVLRDAEVETDPRRVERILANLVANALRHGRPPVTVTVDGAEVRVADHGPGFPPDMLARLREHGPQRFASGAAARGTGVGLGLTIAAGQARMLGADLEFGDSGSGAVVTLRLRESSSHHR